MTEILPQSVEAAAARRIFGDGPWYFSILIAAGLFASSSLARADDSPDANEWFAAGPRLAWLANYDPTLIGRRVVTECSYEDERDGKFTLKTSLSTRYAHDLLNGLAVGTQLEVPTEWTQGGSGLGRLELRVGMVGRITPTLRWGAGLNTKLPTETNTGMGSNSFELKPIAMLSWEVTPWLNIGLTGNYSFTPTHEGPESVSKIEMDLPVAVKIAERWSAAFIYKPTFDFVAHDTTQAAEIDVTKIWGRNNQYATTIGTKFPLGQQSLQWKVIVSLAWYF